MASVHHDRCYIHDVFIPRRLSLHPAILVPKRVVHGAVHRLWLSGSESAHLLTRSRVLAMDPPRHTMGSLLRIGRIYLPSGSEGRTRSGRGLRDVFPLRLLGWVDLAMVASEVK